LRAMPAEDAPSGGQRFARGIWEGDRLPGLDFDGERSEPTELKLALMELGQGEQGLSWAARTLALLDEHGPFLLAWLESLVRIADWRASAREQLAETDATVDTSHHGLENQHRALAQADPGAEAGDSAAADSPEGGEQHGVRGGTGGQGDVGARTRTPDHATREIETALGVIPYAELSNHLSVRVEQLAVVIAEGEFDDRPLDEALIRELHGRICGDLTPQFAGIWRQVDVVVGTHEPPPPWQLAPAMRDFLADLRVRLEHLAPKPDELWLETLAFAEGRLLSIHPFQDFNGRLTRVFIDLLLARLDLPDVEPIPAYGQPTQTYLDALRAADQNDWRPLMTIWKQRLEEASDHV
ncbi:MAG: Fic family protein, partial [Gammaproteobacteria bacterium]